MAQFLITFVNMLFNILMLLIIARVLLSFFPDYRYQPIGEFIYNVTDPIITPFQRLNLQIGMFDLSPVVALLVLNLLQYILVNMLSSYFGLL